MTCLTCRYPRSDYFFRGLLALAPIQRLHMQCLRQFHFTTPFNYTEGREDMSFPRLLNARHARHTTMRSLRRAQCRGMKRLECVAPRPGRPCSVGLYVIENSARYLPIISGLISTMLKTLPL